MSAASTAVVSRAPASIHGTDALFADSVVAVLRIRAFHTLDALRGIAATAIVLFHASFIYGIGKPAEGQLAVDLFFAMSGFIIAHRYDADLRAGMSVRRFLAVRLIRLYPLFLLGTLLGLLPSLVTLAAQGRIPFHVAMVASLPEALAMLPSFVGVPGNTALYPLNIVSWSLALEVAINLAYAATFTMWTLPRLVGLVGVGLGAIAACAATYGTLHLGFEWSGVVGGPARILYGFSAGVLIHRLRERGRLRLRVAAWLPIVATLLLLCMPAQGSKAAWEFCACAVAVPAILVAAVSSDMPQQLRRLCALAGLYSYLVYSLHEPLVGVLLRAETRLGMMPGGPSAIGAIAFTLLGASACVAAHSFYDKPVRRWLTRTLDRRDGRGRNRSAAHSAQSQPSL